MPNQNNNLIMGKASLKFFLTAIGMITLSLLITWLILLLNGKFTYWAILPLLAGFPITILVNVNLAKRVFAQTHSESHEGESEDEQPE